MFDFHSKGLLLSLLLIFSVGLIILSSLRWKWHPFISLTIASLFFGLGSLWVQSSGQQNYDLKNVVNIYTQGFGDILSNIGLVIVFGVLLGKILERTGAAFLIAQKILQLMGVQQAAWSLSFLGWVISIPVFCDSGYILLNSLKKSLAKISGVSLAILSISLATGLYASHTFVPPTPGPLVASSNIGLPAHELIWVIVFGAGVSFVSMLAGGWTAQNVVPYLLKIDKVKSMELEEKDRKSYHESQKVFTQTTFLNSILPMLLPLFLIALSSLFEMLEANQLVQGFWVGLFQFIGHPLIALMLGFALAHYLLARDIKSTSDWTIEALQDASVILLITGAGGGFGAMIKASPLSEIIKAQFQQGLTSPLLALWLLFLIAALLKTAQGSSTASLVITSSLAGSLLEPFGLSYNVEAGPPIGPVLAVMAMGAGAMVMSHINDSYFWVVTQLSGLSVSQGYRSQTIATFTQGFIAMLVVSLLAILFL